MLYWVVFRNPVDNCLIECYFNTWGLEIFSNSKQQAVSITAATWLGRVWQGKVGLQPLSFTNLLVPHVVAVEMIRRIIFPSVLALNYSWEISWPSSRYALSNAVFHFSVFSNLVRNQTMSWVPDIKTQIRQNLDSLVWTVLSVWNKPVNYPGLLFVTTCVPLPTANSPQEVKILS